MSSKVRSIAFYLPQYHPIPENDEWWGKGFTEWTNVGKAKSYFPGHYQPRVPADLGYYDLRVPETRKAQAEMARAYGIEGFCYWHYWFGNGKRLLERPFNEVLQSGEPDFPFCLAWANESWKGFHHGLTNRNVLIEQVYPGEKDYENHFYELLPAFRDKRYITVHGKPVFMIFKPMQLPDARSFISLWQNLAVKNGLKGIYFVGHSYTHKEYESILNNSFDAINTVRLFDFLRMKRNLLSVAFRISMKTLFRVPSIFSFKQAIEGFSNAEDSAVTTIPTIISGWDHTPRSGKQGLILHHATPELFEQHVTATLKNIMHKPDQERLVFIKSWNEWAEGNYMEPDLKYGTGFLEAYKRAVDNMG